MMDLTEHLIRSCAKAAFPAGISSIPYQEHTLDLEAPFRKASMQELVQEATGMHLILPACHDLLQQARRALQKVSAI